jgi:hypothetical protein
MTPPDRIQRQAVSFARTTAGDLHHPLPGGRIEGCLSDNSISRIA